MKKNTENTLKKSKKRYIVFGVIGTVVLLLGGWWAWSNFSPKPLGGGLEYIGKEDYGCWIICDSNPASTYYYATDMSVDELIRYFKHTRLDQEPRTVDNITDFSLINQNNKDILIYYYNDKQSIFNKYSFFVRSEKKYVIHIPDFDYQAAKDSL